MSHVLRLLRLLVSLELHGSSAPLSLFLVGLVHFLEDLPGRCHHLGECTTTIGSHFATTLHWSCHLCGGNPLLVDPYLFDSGLQFEIGVDGMGGNRKNGWDAKPPRYCVTNLCSKFAAVLKGILT